jgi:hypothetical protein
MSSRIALLIGNGTYDDPAFRALERPPADVHALQRVLADPEIGGFDEVVPLIDADANAVRKQIAGLFKNRSADDVLLLFYAGHGVKDDFGELHLVTRDTTGDELSATAIPSHFVSREMDRSRSLNQILILDCCFSGAFTDARAAEAGSVGARESFRGNGTGRVILTASDAFEFAWERDEGSSAANSVFTACLVAGLENGEADRDCDGFVSVDEWYDYVYERMQRSARKQTPHRTVAGAGSIVVARSRKPSIELPEDLRIGMKSPFPRVREGVARSLAEMLFDSNPAVARAAREHLARMCKDVHPGVSAMAKALIEGRAPLPTAMPVPLPVLPMSPKPQPRPAPPRIRIARGFPAIALIVAGFLAALFSTGPAFNTSGAVTNEARIVFAILGALGVLACGTGIAFARDDDETPTRQTLCVTSIVLVIYLVVTISAVA